MKRTWGLQVGDAEYTITLDYNRLTGKRSVLVDGVSVVDEWPMNNFGFDYWVTCADHHINVGMRRHLSGLLPNEYFCEFAGQSLPEQKTTERFFLLRAARKPSSPELLRPATDKLQANADDLLQASDPNANGNKPA